MQKILAILVCTFAPLAFSQNAAMPGEGVTVRPAIGNWDSAKPIAQIFVSLLGELGYEVETPKTLANAIFYQSLVLGDVDYWAHSWIPNQNNQIPADFEENAAFAGTVVKGGAIQGYLVDRASAEEYDITSLADFSRDEVKAAFDSNGDGKADLVGCEAGWACADVVDFQMEQYGLGEDINVLDASYNAMFADVTARFQAGEPVLYYTWTPNFTVSKLKPGEDVEWINVPEIVPTPEQEELVETMTVSDVAGAVSNPLKMGFPANDIRVAANNTFLEENPAAKALFAEIKIPLADVSDMTARISEGENSDADITAMVETWLSDHQEEIDGWLETARAAAE